MIANLFLFLTRGSGSRRRRLFHFLFEKLAKISRHQTAWTFMNYGYGPPKERLPELLLTSVEASQYVCCALYDAVVSDISMEGVDVVEISCGRGGGSAFIARHMKPRSVLGIDISRSAIDFCRRVHLLENLRFVQGDAENLPLFNSSYDAVVNVEASFCYGNFNRFLDEVFRVLRPGGVLLYADLRFVDELPEWFTSIENTGFDLLYQEDISQNVICGLDTDADRRERELRQNAPRILWPALRTFGGTRGSRIPKLLIQRDLRYYRFALRKPLNGEVTTESRTISGRGRSTISTAECEIA